MHFRISHRLYATDVFLGCVVTSIFAVPRLRYNKQIFFAFCGPGSLANKDVFASRPIQKKGDSYYAVSIQWSPG